jgi:hypothetical protein
MAEAALSPLLAWDNFYVIVGSSAAALTGLQFVVITLVAEAEPFGNEMDISTFGTPTIIHFCAALLVSAILSAPWKEAVHAGVVLACCGVAGIIYELIIVHRARVHTNYKPVLEDWLWHVIFPLIAYVALCICGFILARDPFVALFIIAGASLLLLFTGIHNSWDTVIYIVLRHMRRPKE